MTNSSIVKKSYVPNLHLVSPINISTLSNSIYDSNYKVNIKPSQHPEETSYIKQEHDAQPFKSMEDIKLITDYYLLHDQYRNYLVFICGINFGLREWDLLHLRFKDIINNDNTFKVGFNVFEKKTRNTRITPKNRYIPINNAVKQAVVIYLQHNPNTSLDDYMFKNESRNSNNINEPMTRKGLEYVIKSITKKLNIEGRYNTHSLRKTFSYQYMMKNKDDSRALYKLQKILGHSSPEHTLRYIGLDKEELSNAYMNLNLGIDYTLME